MERGWIAVMAAAVLAAAATARGIEYPPYEVYGYLADEGDDPPLNYMKVCEPGAVGEENASYVVLGVSYPRTRPAVAAGYEGPLAIPAYIDGLPVRKIGEAAFIQCTKLTSVSVPGTVREIGDRAFADCWQLAEVAFEPGVARVGNGAFSNCLSLAELDFPATLSRLGAGCFQGCVELRDVYFRGNAPRLAEADAGWAGEKSYLGEGIFRQTGYSPRFRVHVDPATSGWIAPGVKGVPEKWPVDFGYMQAHETVEEPGGGGGAPGPSGFVAVVTEIGGADGGAVAVPESWAERFPEYENRFGADFTASLTRPTGKRDAAGNALAVWQDYVAGTDPTDPDDVFAAWLEMDGDTPRIVWKPVLDEAEAAKRRYRIWACRSLPEGDWEEISASRTGGYNFFKLRVEMK